MNKYSIGDTLVKKDKSCIFILYVYETNQGFESYYNNNNYYFSVGRDNRLMYEPAFLLNYCKYTKEANILLIEKSYKKSNGY